MTTQKSSNGVEFQLVAPLGVADWDYELLVTETDGKKYHLAFDIQEADFSDNSCIDHESLLVLSETQESGTYTFNQVADMDEEFISEDVWDLVMGLEFDASTGTVTYLP